MKRIILSALCALPLMASGQVLLYNDGAMLKVEAGATLFVEGGIQNTSSGTIDNDGIIELQGNFINAGTWEPSQPNTLKFSGNNDADITSGSAVFQTVQMAKGSGGDLTLLSHMTVNTNLDFNGANNKIILGSKHLKLGGATTITGYDDDEYVVTDGTGRMKKFYSSTGAFEFPVGFNATTYNRAEVNVTAGPADTISVRVLASPTDGNGLTGTAITSDVVDAVWDISESTVGGNTANIKLGWAESDELTGFDDLLNTVSRNDGTNGWEGLFADLGPEVSNTRTKDGYTAFGAFAVGDKPLANALMVNAKAFLHGPFINASGLMVDSLRVHDYIPLIEPYSTLPSNPYNHEAYGGGEQVTSLAVFNQPADGDDIVDWIIVELRDASAPTTILASKCGLIQRDGDIVDLDGTSKIAVLGVADGSYKVALRHRNHLGIRTDASYSLNNSVGSLIDFTQLSTAFDDGAVIKPTTPLRLLTGSTYGLWAGDANFNGVVLYNGGGNDRLVVLTAVGLATPGNSVTGYNRADCNLNGITLYNGGGNDRLVILNTVGLATPGDNAVHHLNN